MYISAFDAVGLTEYWATLEQYVFVHVDQTQMSVVHRLKTSVQRVCLVMAVQAGRGDKVNEFFDKLIPHVHSQPDWRDWLGELNIYYKPIMFLKYLFLCSRTVITFDSCFDSC